MVKSLMEKFIEYRSEDQKTYEELVGRYQRFYAKDSEPPAFIQAPTEEALVANALEWIEEKGENLPLYHGTHSGFAKDVVSKKLYPPLFLAAGAFQSAQYALERAWTDNGMRRVNNLEKVQPVLFEVKVDLRDLAYDVIHPGPYAVAKKDIGIGVSEGHRSGKPQLFEIQLVSSKAEERLQAAEVNIVASGENLVQLLRWSQEHIGHFPLEILLED